MPKPQKFTKASVAREYRDRYGMEMPTLKLARIMFAENETVFNNVDNARTVLRSIEGKSGGQVLITHPIENRPLNPYRLPESDERDWQPYILKGYKKVGLISDIHVPYHNIPAVTCAIDDFISFGVDCLLINGDGIDFYGLSRFERDPRKRSFNDELESFAELITVFKENLKCKILFKLGNHEERYDAFLMRKAHELVGVPEFTIEALIKNRCGQDVEIIKDKRVIQANALDIIHGHEFAQGFFSPVNVARGLCLRAKTNAIQGHNHQTSEHTETNLRGEIKTTWSKGCTCELHPEYMPINKWNHGHAKLELSDNSDEFKIINVRSRKGKIL